MILASCSPEIDLGCNFLSSLTAYGLSNIIEPKEKKSKEQIHFKYVHFKALTVVILKERITDFCVLPNRFMSG